jgi:hypothetical protein
MVAKLVEILDIKNLVDLFLKTKAREKDQKDITSYVN